MIGLLADRVADDTISALHKSVRGSDADASLYYLARMLQSGEDPLYIAVSSCFLVFLTNP